MTVSHSLPPAVTTALPGIHWSLAREGPPLYLKSIDELEHIRETPQQELFRDIVGTAKDFAPHGSSPEASYFGTISLALILLGHDLTDECHNLITPLSWPDDIHFAHGSSLYSKASIEVQAFSSYVHSLVHRKEAFHHGEFGMMGFNNANYWSDAAARSTGSNVLPHAQLQQQVRALSLQHSDSAAVQEWCRKMVNSDDIFFDGRPVHQLCAAVLLQNPKDPILQNFAEQVAESEIRILLSHALRKAGFVFDDSVVLRDLGTNDMEHPPVFPESQDDVAVNTDAALLAARKVSSAHLDLFRAQGSVIIRQVGEDNLSAAAGIACRLLGSPACRLTETPSTSDTVVAITVDSSDLQAGDMWARKGVYESALLFEPAAADDSLRTFVDPLFGTRGETPTTVIQWSKGTVF